MHTFSIKPDISSNAILHNNIQKPYRQIEVEYNPFLKILTTYLDPFEISCFNMGILHELRQNDIDLEKNNGQFFYDGKACPINYHVVASRNPKVFSFGGDLSLFIKLIKSRDKEGLMQYAKLCIDCIYARITGHHSSAITISLVQGEALGGGFETALTSNIVIAEESARMGLPEILFNLFPGMGAYSLLSRRVGARLAEEIISSGNIYHAEELYKMGIVDMLVEDGEGKQAILDLARQQKKHLNGLQSIYACRRYYQPITYDELMNITSIWVEAALNLTEKDLQMMNRLVRSQKYQAETYTHRTTRNESKNLELVAA